MIDRTKDWHRFQPTTIGKIEGSRSAHSYAGQSVLITGAAGDIGSALADALQPEQLNCLLLLDSTEHGLFELQRHVEKRHIGTRCEFILGSISDEHLIHSILARFRPDCIFHTAAFKHVGLLERNMRAAVENNALGTYKLLRAAEDHRVNTFLLLSTDKAVRPSSVLGASKQLAELFVLAQSSNRFRASVIRLVNVIGSRGSVVPILLDQLRHNEPLSITDKTASRFFLSKQESVDAILEAGSARAEGKIFVPHCGPSIPITELANFLARAENSNSQPEFRFTGLQPGEKLREELHGRNEVPYLTACRLSQVYARERPSLTEASEMATDLTAALNDADRLLELLRQLLPSYTPSSTVLAQANQVMSAD